MNEPWRQALLRRLNEGRRIAHLMRAGHYPEALSGLSDRLSEDPKSWTIRWQMGSCYSEMGDYASAITAYSDAAQLAPNKASIYISLGRTYERAGDYSRAIDSLKRAITLDPSSANIYDSLGHTHLRAGQYDAAITAFDSCLDTHAASIYANLKNSRSSCIFKHQVVMGKVWMEMAMKAAVNAAIRELGTSAIVIPDGKGTEREEQPEEHEGLYYVDMISEGRQLRMLLPNYFYTFRERLRGTTYTAFYFNSIGEAYLAIDNHPVARARFIESLEFTLPGFGFKYNPSFDNLQRCKVDSLRPVSTKSPYLHMKIPAR